MVALKDLSGRRFGRWFVVGRAESGHRGSTMWKCVCDCGTERNVVSGNLLNGGSKSCGCRKADLAAEMSKRNITHGLHDAPEYQVWSQMKARCCNRRHRSYRYYGGRGISVCKEWLGSFKRFYSDMGPRPSSKHSLDRIDNDGNYEPGNCRWATRTEQANNTRRCQFVEFNGETKTVTQWAGQIGIPPDRLFYRLHKGWDVERALTTPFVATHE